MSNNVVPGDLAYIKGAPSPGLDWNEHFVKVVKRDPTPPLELLNHDHGVVWWEIESCGWLFDDETNICSFPDRYLRPIRDPGDDAVDEMLVLTGAPQHIKENATQ